MFAASLVHSVPVGHQGILLSPEHDANIGGVISGGVEVSVVSCGNKEFKSRTAGNSHIHTDGLFLSSEVSEQTCLNETSYRNIINCLVELIDPIPVNYVNVIC